MTQAQHTPGPWVCHSGMVWKDGPNVYPKGTQEDGVPIAYMDRETADTLPVERDANARLIAAAPQLLEALERVTYALGMIHDFGTATEGEGHPDTQNRALDNAHDLMATIKSAVGSA